MKYTSQGIENFSKNNCFEIEKGKTKKKTLPNSRDKVLILAHIPDRLKKEHNLIFIQY